MNILEALDPDAVEYIIREQLTRDLEITDDERVAEAIKVVVAYYSVPEVE